MLDECLLAQGSSGILPRPHRGGKRFFVGPGQVLAPRADPAGRSLGQPSSLAHRVAGPGGIIRYRGKFWGFLTYSDGGPRTKLAVSENGYDWKDVHDRPILAPEKRWEGRYAGAKAALAIDDKVIVYYFGKQDIQERMGVATSTNADLSRADWVKHPDNPVFSKDDLAKKVQRLFPDCVLEEGGKYYLFFDSGYDYHHPKYPRQYTINVARGRDGIHFKELASDLITPGPKGSWESQAVSQATVKRVGDWWYMIYSGFPKGPSKTAQAFGLARARRIEGPWEKYPGNPIFTATGDRKDWDGLFVQHACLVKIDGTWHLYYNGNDGKAYREGVAILRKTE